jgi:UDP-glucose:(heptosyl)LPS alpha-1,3-glucosyltransferase
LTLRPRKARLAVISPFIDKRHGTERRVAEWIAQLTATYDIHIYSQDVRDVDLTRVTWHRIPKFPGPHILNFLWWFAANRALRAWHRRIRGLRHDIVFSPGINCFDADAISVHIVFAEYVNSARTGLSFTRNPVRAWPRLLHQKLYYQLAIALERHVYGKQEASLILIARRTAAGLKRFYGHCDNLPVVYAGLDHEIFNPQRRSLLREKARKELALSSDRFALVIVSNDGRNKGLPVIFQALSTLRELPIELLVVTRENPASYFTQARDAGLEGRVHFLAPRDDIEFYYAAADAYAGPSLEDTFAQPPAEAMACGMPVIVSANNGTCEIITDGRDGLILADPTDAGSLAGMIRRLYEDKEFSAQIGKHANETARQYTWERNGRELGAIFQQLLERKSRNVARTVAQES